MTLRSDENNVLLVDTANSVDRLNAGFYGRFPYPWSPSRLDVVRHPRLYTMMLSQEIGDWRHDTLPDGASIWVAGCGTNQAVMTALKFPTATVIGSDVSINSLDICEDTARQLGIENLELRNESINQTAYKEEFDYVVCTGVIHHNANPQATLDRLTEALKPRGVMELMVYNRFHWIVPVAFQQAVRLMGFGSEKVDFDWELPIARKILAGLPREDLMRKSLAGFEDSPESMFADGLLQPVLYSYTVDSLEQMAAGSGLEILLPCLNQFDRGLRRYDWNMEFDDPAVAETYYSLPDTVRWQISNLLQLDKSPMLWFFLQRSDSGRPRKSEHDVCEEFLDTVFEKNEAAQTSYIRDYTGRYHRFSSTRIPAADPDSSVRTFLDLIDGKTAMRDIFHQAGVEAEFRFVNRARVMLTTSICPYLRAVAPVQAAEARQTAAANIGQGEKKKLNEFNLNKLKSIKPLPLTIPA